MGLAANRYRLANKRFPESIDELIPKWIKSVPLDVVSGKPLNYRLEDGKPLIYSVGVDLDDDNGVEAVDPLGKTFQEMNLDESRHLLDTVDNVYRLDGDWILWPAIDD